MTLGNAAAPHVRLIVWGKVCSHQVEPDPAEMDRPLRRRNGRARSARRAGLLPIRQPAGRDQPESKRSGRGRLYSVTVSTLHVPSRPHPTVQGAAPFLNSPDPVESGTILSFAAAGMRQSP